MWMALELNLKILGVLLGNFQNCKKSTKFILDLLENFG
jgi:hypothetical protein